MSERFETGLKIRTEVLGREYVERAFSSTTEFTEEFQRYVTEFCWGMTWPRAGLDRRTRSLLTISILASRGQWSEFASHVRGALRNGCTTDELKEALLHLAVYAGVPTGVAAFREAACVVEQWERGEGAASTA